MSDVAAGSKVFLVPVGRENDHQRTIDGESPVGPCWGFTDGNHLAGRIKEGDMLLFIRAGSRRSPATIYRLGLVEQSTKNPDLASQLYKTQHNYNMGGKRKRDVPFTWIVQLKKVLAITWDKKAFLAKIGISDKDPILSARPVTQANGKNAIQARQMLQQCQMLLASNPGLYIHPDSKTKPTADVHVNNKQSHQQTEEIATLLPVVTSHSTEHSLCSSADTASNCSPIEQCSNLSGKQPASCTHAAVAQNNCDETCMCDNNSEKQQLKATSNSSEAQSLQSHQMHAARQDSQIWLTLDTSDSDTDKELEVRVEGSALPHSQRLPSYGTTLPENSGVPPSLPMLWLTYHLAAKHGLQWVLKCNE